MLFKNYCYHFKYNTEFKNILLKKYDLLIFCKTKEEINLMYLKNKWSLHNLFPYICSYFTFDNYFIKYYFDIVIDNNIYNPDVIIYSGLIQLIRNNNFEMFKYILDNYKLTNNVNILFYNVFICIDNFVQFAEYIMENYEIMDYSYKNLIHSLIKSDYRYNNIIDRIKFIIQKRDNFYYGIIYAVVYNRIDLIDYIMENYEISNIEYVIEEINNNKTSKTEENTIKYFENKIKK